MADVFDQLDQAPRKDVFDEVSSSPAQPDVFDQVETQRTDARREAKDYIQRTTSVDMDRVDQRVSEVQNLSKFFHRGPGLEETPVLSPNDPRFEEVATGVSAGFDTAQAIALPHQLDFTEAVPVTERFKQINAAEDERLALEEKLRTNFNDPTIPGELWQAKLKERRLKELHAQTEAGSRPNFEQIQAGIQEKFGAVAPEDVPNLFQTGSAKILEGLHGMAAPVADLMGLHKNAESLREDMAVLEKYAGARKGVGADVVRGITGVVPLVVGLPQGKLGALQATLRASAQSYSATLERTGDKKAAFGAAVQTAPEIAAFMLAGAGAGKAVAAMLPKNAGAMATGLANFAGAEIANIGVSNVLQALHGGEYGLSNLSADTLFALFHGWGGYKGKVDAATRERVANEIRSRGWSQEQIDAPFEAGKETPAFMFIKAPDVVQSFPREGLMDKAAMDAELLKQQTEEPTNAEQISETSAPDGGVRPRGEVPIVPPEEGGTGVQPSGQGERMAEGPRSPSPQKITREEASAHGPEAIQAIMDKLGVEREEAVQIQSEARQTYGISREAPRNETPQTIEEIAASNGVKYDGPTELPGNPHQFTDQRTGSTFIVLGEPTAEKVQAKVDKIDQSYGLEPRERNLGPGAANVEEPLGTGNAIGAKNASVDAQRAERGLPPLMSEGRKANPETWAAVERRVETDPEYPARIVNEIENGERKSVTDEDQAALLWRMVDLRNQRDVADQRAQDEQTYSPEERAAYEEQANGIESELQRTEEADRKIGTKSARALQIRKIMANEDFTLAAMERRARKTKGDALTPDERATIKTQSEKIQETQKALEERTTKLEEEDAGKAVDESIRDIEIEASKNPEFTPEVKSLADRIIARLDKMADAALKRLREKGFALGSSPDPTIAIDVAIYGAAKIGKGVVKFSRWAAEMVKELGEGVKPYLQEAWQSANKNIDDQIAGTKTKKPKEVKAAVTKENAVATAEEIGAKMKAKGGKLTAMRGDIQKLVETLVRGGVKGRDAVVDAVHEVLKQVDPSITRRQTMDAISGYGDFKQLSKDAIKAEVRDIKQQLQLVAKIQDIQARIPLQKSGVERQRLSDESRRLTAELNENIKKFGVRITDPETQLRTMLAATETRLTNRIKDLKAEIAAGERRVKTKTPTPTNEKIEALRKELAEVQAEHKKVLGEIKQTEEQRLNIYKKALQRRTKDLQDRIAKGDFAKRPRKELDISKDPEAVRLKAENERVKKEFAKARFEDEQRKRTTLRKGIDVVKETLAASRSLITSADVSAPLRQGGFLLIGDLFFHPIRVAKQLGTMFHQLVSEKGFQRAQAAISLRPNADLYQQSKLYFSDMDGKLSAREENMRSTLAERIPAVGRIIRASNRAYSGFLNRQRADAFDAMIEARGGKNAVTPEGAKLMADAVNTLTGRGSIGATNEGAANFLARYLFSPRFLASRFQTVLGKPILGALGKGASLADRRVIAKQYAKFAIGLGAIYGLAQLAGAKVEKDPRSSDFGKLRFRNTRVDPLAGLAQVTVLMARTATGKTKAQGELKPVTADTYYQFARSKLAPVPGALLDLRTGKNVVGEKTTLGSVAQSLMVPLSYQDAGKIFQAHGPFAGTVLTMLNLLGAGTQHYKR